MMSRQAHINQSPIRYVKGIGPSRAEKLARIGINTVEDALYFMPRRYEDRSKFIPISKASFIEPASFKLKVLAKSFRRARTGRPVVEVAMGDPTGRVQCRWFNQPYIYKQMRVGDEFIVYGRIEPGRNLLMTHPEIERIGGSEDGDYSLHIGRIVPIYPLTEGLGQRWLRKTIFSIVCDYSENEQELIPSDMRSRLDLPDLDWSIRQVHFPESLNSGEQARRRLVFDELFLMQLRMAIRRSRVLSVDKLRRYELDGKLASDFLENIPFELTRSQLKAIKEMTDDLSRSYRMFRLLQGDVGCGKTVVAAYLMAIAIQSGYQVAFMAPTELLARQHHRMLSGYFENMNVFVGLLSQGVNPEKRKDIEREISAGKPSIIIGTHALLEEDLVFSRLALVVIDEQHKFGVSQRSLLAKKGNLPDVLVMTATPIPRTLALSIYGDLSCSTIKELPPGRLTVKTMLFPEDGRGDAYQIIKDELNKGRQGYIVYPLVEADERKTLKAATDMFEEMRKGAFAEFGIGLLHGQMDSKSQENVMLGFMQGRIKLLVSTVIVEVGLDVANATFLLIEHAERFGLAQLHQLRGRIGRGKEQAFCLAISQSQDEDVKKRLEAFRDTSDGFKLAEVDLGLRGPGDLLGRRQHGWLKFRVADLVNDLEILEQARREAFSLVDENPGLSGNELAGLKKRINLKG